MSIVDFPSQGTIGASLKPKRYDIELYQGDDFAFSLVFKNGSTPLDVTAWDAIAQIKKVDDNTPGETPNMTVMIGGTDGKITIKLSNTGTAALQGTTTYKYDVQVADATTQRTFIGGLITVVEDISEFS